MGYFCILSSIRCHFPCILPLLCHPRLSEDLKNQYLVTCYRYWLFKIVFLSKELDLNINRNTPIFIPFLLFPVIFQHLSQVYLNHKLMLTLMRAVAGREQLPQATQKVSLHSKKQKDSENSYYRKRMQMSPQSALLLCLKSFLVRFFLDHVCV